MKKLLQIIGIGVLIATTSCNEYYGEIGPPGPRGPAGPVGPQGAPGEIGYVFEYEEVSFFGPDYEAILPFPEDFETFHSDVVLVYFLWEVLEIDGEILEVWRPLPQQVLTLDGLLQYNFDFTLYDVRLWLDAEFPLDLLASIDTDDWVARVVVVPGEFWNGGRVDFNDYNAVKEAMGLPDLNTKYSKVGDRR